MRSPYFPQGIIYFQIMSNFFDDLFNKVFRNSDDSTVNHKENFKIKEAELKEAVQWAESEDGEEKMNLVYKNYHFKKTQIDETPQIHVLDSPYANGFAVIYDFPFNDKSFSMLFLAFSQRVIALGYRQVSLDRKFEEVNDQVRLIEKFYFKPPLQTPIQGELISQLYGNVTLEKVTVDNRPSFIKFLVTVYSDRYYDSPRPFDQLLDLLFNVNKDG